MTLTEKAYAVLRLDIIRGTFAADVPLRLSLLKDRYGFGFSPLREALTKLESEHLVVSESLKGFRVAPLSVTELRDNMQTRIFIETEALRRSILNGNDEWETNIVAKLHALKLQVKRTTPGNSDEIEKLEDCHYQFHHALIAACNSACLMDFFQKLYSVSARYRLPQLRASAAIPGRDIAKEHSDIAAATIDRNNDLAAELLSKHYWRTAEMLEDSLGGRSK